MQTPAEQQTTLAQVLQECAGEEEYYQWVEKTRTAYGPEEEAI